MNAESIRKLFDQVRVLTVLQNVDSLTHMEEPGVARAAYVQLRTRLRSGQHA